MIVPGSPSDLNIGNGTEVAMVCTGLGSLFYFLCSNLKANPVQFPKLRNHKPVAGCQCPAIQAIQRHLLVCLERQTGVYGLSE